MRGNFVAHIWLSRAARNRGSLRRLGCGLVGVALIVSGVSTAVAVQPPAKGKHPRPPAPTAGEKALAKNAGLTQQPMALTSDGRLVRQADIQKKTSVKTTAKPTGKAAAGKQAAKPTGRHFSTKQAAHKADDKLRADLPPAMTAPAQAPDWYVVERGRVSHFTTGEHTSNVSTSSFSSLPLATVAVTTGSISGTVTESGSGAALPGVLVIAYAFTSSTTATTTSGAGGTYTTTGLPADQYRLRFEDHTAGHIVKSTTALVTAGATTSNVNAALAPGGALSGKITGISGAPVSGVCASLIGQSVSTDAGGCSDANGNFQTTGAPAGSYKVSFTDTAGPYLLQYYTNTTTYAAATPVNVTIGHVTPNINAVMARGATFSGTVTDSANNQPLSSICVTVWSSIGAWMGQRCTDAQGHYTSPGLAPGSYKADYLDGNGTGYLEQFYNGKADLGSANAIAVTAGSDTPGVNAAMQLGGSISGVVTDAATGGPIAGACAWASSATVNSYGGACTDAAGAYRVKGLRTGTYTVQFTGSSVGYLSKFYKDQDSTATPVTVAQGADTPNINQALAVGGTITGTVTAGGQPVHACVSASSLAGFGSACTAADGTYAIIGLPSGAYTVEFDDASGQGYLPQFWDHSPTSAGATPVPVVQGQTTSGKNASLTLGGRITGTVSGAGAGGIKSCVVAYSAAGDYVGQQCTDTTGQYQIVGLPTGSYRLNAFDAAGQGYLSRWYDGKTSDNTADLVAVTQASVTSGKNFTLPVGGRITGTVTAPGGAPAAACVDAQSNDSFGSTCTAADGTYTILGLAAGTYTVHFQPNSPDGYVGQWWHDVTNSSSATTVAVVEGGTASGIDATFQLGARISGTITDAVTGAPVGNICARTWSGGIDVADACTDGSGNYTLVGLPAATYHVQFTDPGGNYADQWYAAAADEQHAANIVLNDAQVKTGIDAGMAKLGTISGTVHVTGTSPTGVCVSAYADVNTTIATGTVCPDAAGHYAIPLPAGQYVVAFGGQRYLSNAVEFYDGKFSAATANLVSVHNGADTPGIDVSLGSISGTVTEAGTAKPLQGVCVNVSPASVTWNPVGYACTDQNGRYVVGPLAAGQYVVEFNDPSGPHLEQWYSGKSSAATADLVAVTAGATTGQVDVAMAVGGQITGTIIDGAGKQPLANVCVDVLFANSQEYVGSSRCTNDSGVYRTPGLPTGDYKLRFAAAAGTPYVAQWYNDQNSFDAANAVHLTAGTDTNGINASLAKGGSISGTITDAATGQPISNVCAQAFTGTDVLVASDCTDATGTYTTAGLPTGTYYVYFVEYFGAQGYQAKWYDNATDLASAKAVAVTANNTTSGISAALSIGGTISGTVTDTVTQAPLAGICISAFDNVSSNFGYGCTDSAGHYQTSGVPTGSYTVRFSGATGPYLNQYYGATDANPTGQAVSVTTGQDTSAIDIALAKGSVISGTVTDSASGLPVSNVCVSVSPADTGTYYPDSVPCSGPDGRYTTAGLPTGSYDLIFSNDGGRYVTQWYSAAATAAGATAVSVLLGTDLTGINAKMVLGGTIAGTVTAAGQPASGICATIYNPDGSFAGNGGCTDANGHYASAAVPAGTYKVGFQDPSGTYIGQFFNGKATLATADAVAITAGATTPNINAALSGVPGGDLAGTVTDSAANPLAGAYVQICNSTLIPGGCRWTTTDNSGAFSSTDLPAGSYAVSASAPGNFTSATKTVTITTLQQTNVTIVVTAPSALPTGASIVDPDNNKVGTAGEVPMLYWQTAYTIHLPGCAGGSGTLTITVTDEYTGQSTTKHVALTEATAGDYVGSVPALYPSHGVASFDWTITCASGTSTGSATVYVDPSGTIVDQSDLPISGATVTLLRSDSASGPFTALPNGDAAMSPANRANPMLSAADGSYGWDVVAGFYKVQAGKESCTTASSDVLTVPPAVTALTLKLTCTAPQAPQFINATPLTTATTGTAYTYTVAASGSPAPTFAVASGALPDGLSLNATTGQLSGTPTRAGVFTFKLSASNGVGTQAITPDIAVTVSSPPQLVNQTPPTAGVEGTAYSYTFTATGSPEPTFAVATGALPDGLNLNTTTGVLSGTPAKPGGFSFTVSASNGVGAPAVTPVITINIASNDTTGPVVTLTAVPANPTTSRSASIGFSGTDSQNPPVTFTCALDGAAATACTSPAGYSSLADGVHKFVVTGKDAVGNASVPVLYSWRVDATKPTVTLKTPTALFSLGGTVAVTWSGSDTGAGVASYQVRYQRAAWNSAFAAWQAPLAWSKLTGTSLSAGLAVGYDYCFQIRVTDKAGNASAYSASKCTARPLDDRALAASSGWTRGTGSVFYLNTITSTRTVGAKLTRGSVQLDRVGIVATRCPTCGVVGVYVGAALIGKINLAYAATQRRAVLVLPRISLRSGTVTLKVLTSGKTVQIDGLAVSRT
jgi:protocatechuate 3,4-dioxygenase beta subunit